MAAGRKTKYTPEIARLIAQLIGGGATQRDACGAVGISEDTLGRWRKRYADFAASIEKAEAIKRAEMIRVVTDAAKGGTWQAAAWYLERRDPDNWGRKDVLRIEGGINVGLVNDTIRAIAEAGLDPAHVFNEMIRKAAAKTVKYGSE